MFWLLHDRPNCLHDDHSIQNRESVAVFGFLLAITFLISKQWKEPHTLTAPFSPMRYDTSPGSTHTANSAGRFSNISVIGTPLSRAARSNTASIGSPVLRHRNAEPCNSENWMLFNASNERQIQLQTIRLVDLESHKTVR